MSKQNHQAVRPGVFQGKLDASDIADKVSLRNLQVTVNAGIDAWGRPKLQPALVSVTLSLAKSFDSAAEGDALDASTVHYGKLSKQIKSNIENGADHVTTGELADRLYDLITETCGQTILRAYELDIFYPKGSLLGDGTGYSWKQLKGNFFSQVVYLQNIRIPCIIGVNANERPRRQPAVVNLWIECLPMPAGKDFYSELEADVVEIISASSFETLESLAAKVVQDLRQGFFSKGDYAGAYIRLRIEKPVAVPFADAPSIEILRPINA